MRILANYACKNYGESYTVTFETLGDLKREEAEETVDELFRLAKEAVQRQIQASSSENKEDLVIPEPKKNGNGKHTNGNGNGNGNSIIKDPDASISPKQRNLIIKLAKERGVFIENLDEMNMSLANETIQELLAVTA
jgi:hypothetical protein